MATIEQRIQFIIDSQSQSKAKSSLRSLQKDIQGVGGNLRQSFQAGEASAEEFNNALELVERELRQVEDALDRLERPRSIDIRTEQFDRVSRDVGLAGDVQSNLGAISGLAGAAGATGAASGIGIAGELIVLTEELPRLKTALQGLPAAAKSAVAAIGVGGFGVIAALSALAAVGFKVANELSQAGESLGGEFAASLQVQLDAVNGLTQEGAQQRLAILKAEQQVLTDAIANGEARRAELVESGSEIIKDTLVSIFDTAIIVFQEIGRAIGQLISAGIEAIFTGDFSKIREVAGELGDNILDAIAAPFITGSIDEELNSAREQLDTTTDSISALEKALADGTFKAAASNIEDATQATRDNSQAQRQQADATQQAEQAAQQAAQAQTNYRDKLRDISQGLRDSLDDLGTDTQRQFEDLRRETAQAEIDAERQKLRDLQQIREDAARSEQDALRGRDFAALFGSREDTEDAIQERLEEFRLEGQDRLEEARRQREDILREEERKADDLRRNAARQRRDAQQALADSLRQENSIRTTFYRQSVNDTQNWANAMREAVQSALVMPSRNGGTSTTTESAFDRQFRDAMRPVGA